MVSVRPPTCIGVPMRARQIEEIRSRARPARELRASAGEHEFGEHHFGRAVLGEICSHEFEDLGHARDDDLSQKVS